LKGRGFSRAVAGLLSCHSDGTLVPEESAFFPARVPHHKTN
jgi:hypothetical protein